jgi:hypothetical protein
MPAILLKLQNLIIFVKSPENANFIQHEAQLVTRHQMNLTNHRKYRKNFYLLFIAFCTEQLFGLYKSFEAVSNVAIDLALGAEARSGTRRPQAQMRFLFDEVGNRLVRGPWMRRSAHRKFA